MQLHELRPAHRGKKIKRVGRGGKRGTTSGKGQKGQRARAGHRIRPAERDMIQRIPKLRGVKNISLKKAAAVVKTSDLKKIAENQKISPEILVKKGIIKSRKEPVKILFDENPEGSFEIQGIKLSAKAKEAVERAGGKML